MQSDMEIQDPQYIKVLARFLVEQENIYKCSATYPWTLDPKQIDALHQQLRKWNHHKSGSAPPELNEREEINYDMDLWAFDWHAHWKQMRQKK